MSCTVYNGYSSLIILLMLECNYKSRLDDAWVRDSHHNKCSVLQLGLDNQKHKGKNFFDSTDKCGVLTFLLKSNLHFIEFHILGKLWQNQYNLSALTWCSGFRVQQDTISVQQHFQGSHTFLKTFLWYFNPFPWLYFCSLKCVGTYLPGMCRWPKLHEHFCSIVRYSHLQLAPYADRPDQHM